MDIMQTIFGLGFGIQNLTGFITKLTDKIDVKKSEMLAGLFGSIFDANFVKHVLEMIMGLFQAG